MRELLKRSRHWLMVGWFWPLVLLALPNCILNAGPYEGEKHVFEPGNEPKSSAIMCGIPKAEFVQNVVCATDADEEEGIPMAQAAIALRNGVSNIIALDYSPEAVAQCDGQPRKIEYYGTFPDGYTTCINCKTQIPVPYIDGDAACVAQCQDLINFGNDPFNGETQSVLEYARPTPRSPRQLASRRRYKGDMYARRGRCLQSDVDRVLESDASIVDHAALDPLVDEVMRPVVRREDAYTPTLHHAIEVSGPGLGDEAQRRRILFYGSGADRTPSQHHDGERCQRGALVPHMGVVLISMMLVFVGRGRRARVAETARSSAVESPR